MIIIWYYGYKLTHRVSDHTKYDFLLINFTIVAEL